MQVVISRFNENIDWSSVFVNKIVYNKGIDIKGKQEVIKLPNVGREGHTFAYHIINNYDNLEEYTCFLQGNPFDHFPNVIDYIKNFKYNTPFVFLSNNILPCEINGINSHGPLYTCYKELFGTENTNSFIFGAGAQMILSRDTIKQYPKSVYEKILNMLNHDTHPEEGFAMERIWGLMFSPSNNHCKSVITKSMNS